MNSKIRDKIDHFSTRQAAAISGLSVYMVEYLNRSGLVVSSGNKRRPKGRGLARKYIFADLLVLSTYRRMLSTGIEVKKLRESMKIWETELSSISEDVSPNGYILTDGHSVYMTTKDRVVETLTSGKLQFAFSFMVDIETIHKEVISALQSKGWRD